MAPPNKQLPWVATRAETVAKPPSPPSAARLKVEATSPSAAARPEVEATRPSSARRASLPPRRPAPPGRRPRCCGTARREEEEESEATRANGGESSLHTVWLGCSLFLLSTAGEEDFRDRAALPPAGRSSMWCTLSWWALYSSMLLNLWTILLAHLG